MKILDVTEVKSEIIETDAYIYPFYKRYSADNWENLMGESWEPHYNCEEIEALYQEYKRHNQQFHSVGPKGPGRS